MSLASYHIGSVLRPAHRGELETYLSNSLELEEHFVAGVTSIAEKMQKHDENAPN